MRSAVVALSDALTPNAVATTQANAIDGHEGACTVHDRQGREKARRSGGRGRENVRTPLVRRIRQLYLDRVVLPRLGNVEGNRRLWEILRR